MRVYQAKIVKSDDYPLFFLFHRENFQFWWREVFELAFYLVRFVDARNQFRAHIDQQALFLSKASEVDARCVEQTFDYEKIPVFNYGGDCSAVAGMRETAAG